MNTYRWRIYVNGTTFEDSVEATSQSQARAKITARYPGAQISFLG